MKETIDIISNHRSIRKFKNKNVQPEKIKIIIEAAMQASTSSYVMAYSVISVTDPQLKRDLKEISGQEYVAENGHFLVFCADLNRIASQASHEELKEMEKSLQSTEQFIVATVDTALVAQNTVIAAESIGLGVCFIGSLRNDIQQVNNLLKLPEYVVPLFGMALGYPDEQPEKKPRLPIEVVLHENTYQQYDESKQQKIDAFNQQLNNYYQTRTENKRTDSWSDQMIRKYKKAIRMEVTDFVKDKKLNRL
ncbi:oxygen-insensitive NADPH nitroreductase [Virgibacillus kekensis]|uniref:Oxygen-insensitive NADPH nitroreductase n=1 Tax=Virgibacillus kekensis TaxID=202261 RepID=A0ABV9DGD4_9BACI